MRNTKHKAIKRDLLVTIFTPTSVTIFFCVKFDILESFELHFLSTYIHTHTFHGIGSCFPKFYASSPTSFTLQFQLLNGQKNCFSAKLQRSRAIFHWLYCCQRKESFPRYSLCLSLNIYIYIYIFDCTFKVLS